jgi:lysozyme
MRPGCRKNNLLHRAAAFPRGGGNMQASAAAFDLIREFEGFRSETYLDVAGLPTIGYGHKLLHPDSFPDGCTRDLAEQMLACDVDDTEEAVKRLVKVPLTQGQFDALVDFTYNLGQGRLADSTLLKNLNAGKYEDAGRELLRWCRAGGEIVPGLERRREAELALWRGAPSDPAQEVAA